MRLLNTPVFTHYQQPLVVHALRQSGHLLKVCVVGVVVHTRAGLLLRELFVLYSQKLGAGNETHHVPTGVVALLQFVKNDLYFTETPVHLNLPLPLG